MDGVNSATVSDLTAEPGGNDGTTVLTGGWVFFDLDAYGTYGLSGTVRDLGVNSRGVSFAGLTFDSAVVPEPASAGLLAFGLLGLAFRSWRRRR